MFINKAMSLKFLPLGGSGEIGMNLNLYKYSNKWLMIDCGVSFSQNLGIKIITPDPDFIVKRRTKLIGLVLTHAHEDHIGAICLLWPKLMCPIYATPFTIEMVKKKLKSSGLLNQVEIKTIPLSGSFNILPFSIEYVNLTHSIPETSAVIVKTVAGNIVHTGDWKLDKIPLLGDIYNKNRLKDLGRSGVLALVCDSTNATLQGHSGSEFDVSKSLFKIISGQKNRVIISCFSSNVVRLYTIINIAKATNRKVGILGFSLWNIYEIAKSTGYLKHFAFLMKTSEIMKAPRSKVLLLCTGSQGEIESSLSRISRKEYKKIFLSSGDTVIFSSRVIPGNEDRIRTLHLRFKKQNINIITNESDFTHVSGHPSQEDLRDMYKWTRPEILIPVHGELIHMNVQAKLASILGIKHTIVPNNGFIIELLKNTKPKITNIIDTTRLGLDGKELVSVDSSHLQERNSLKESGFISVTIIVNQNLHLIHKPQITCYGFVHKKHIFRIKSIITTTIEDELLKLFLQSNKKVDSIKLYLNNTIKHYALNIIGKSPCQNLHVFLIKK